MCSLTKDAVCLEAGIEGPECVGMHEEPHQGHVHERPCHEHDAILLFPIPVNAHLGDVLLAYEPRKKYPC